jgi:hypothetical protein
MQVHPKPWLRSKRRRRRGARASHHPPPRCRPPPLRAARARPAAPSVPRRSSGWPATTKGWPRSCRHQPCLLWSSGCSRQSPAPPPTKSAPLWQPAVSSNDDAGHSNQRKRKTGGAAPLTGGDAFLALDTQRFEVRVLFTCANEVVHHRCGPQRQLLNVGPDLPGKNPYFCLSPWRIGSSYFTAAQSPCFSCIYLSMWASSSSELTYTTSKSLEPPLFSMTRS